MHSFYSAVASSTSKHARASVWVTVPALTIAPKGLWPLNKYIVGMTSNNNIVLYSMCNNFWLAGTQTASEIRMHFPIHSYLKAFLQYREWLYFHSNRTLTVSELYSSPLALLQWQRTWGDQKMVSGIYSHFLSESETTPIIAIISVIPLFVPPWVICLEMKVWKGIFRYPLNLAPPVQKNNRCDI